ncbi:MAG: T9SS type A sorting domain-containing protein [Putridiphycobacter sp.]
MKSILLLALSVFVINFSFAQDWSVINPNRTVFFQHSDSAYISNTIVVDSTDVLGMDSTFYTGYAFKYCDTCQGFSLAQPIIYRYAKELLGFSITHSSSHQNYILDEDTIYHHAQLSDSWDFNASQTASVVAVGETSILGVTDSIKTIELSTNDTIILSKNYGVIRYPDFENPGAYYDMVGYHEGQNSFGDYLPNFWRTYDFNVGDVFYYSGNGYSVNFDVSSFTKKSIVTILEVLTSGDTIKYKVGYHGYKKMPYYTSVIDTVDYFYLVNYIELNENSFGVTGVQSYLDPPLDFQNFYKFFFVGNLYNPLNTGTPKTQISKPVFSSVYGVGKEIYYCKVLTDSLLKFEDMSDSGTGKLELFNGIGRKYQTYQIFEIMDNDYLEGAIIYGDTLGQVFTIPDDIGVKELVLDNSLDIYPNPTTNLIYLPQAFKTVSVFTTLGQKNLEVNTGDTILDLSALPKGIYLIQAVDQNGTVYQSKIIKN